MFVLVLLARGVSQSKWLSVSFFGRWDDQVYKLSVVKAGSCAGALRRARAARRHTSDEPTVEDRRHVLECYDHFLQTQRKPTAAAIVKRLESAGSSVAAARVRAIIRNRRRAEGSSTRVFRESEEAFQQFADTVPREDMFFRHVQGQPFQWVVTLTGFFDKLQSLVPDKIIVTADFTFRMAVMGYSYGILSVSSCLLALRYCCRSCPGLCSHEVGWQALRRCFSFLSNLRCSSLSSATSNLSRHCMAPCDCLCAHGRHGHLPAHVSSSKDHAGGEGHASARSDEFRRLTKDPLSLRSVT